MIDDQGSMQLATVQYRDGAWSGALPDLDSEQTAILAFGAASYRDRPDLFAQLAAAYPRSHLIGCSTAGEIDRTRVQDDSLVVAFARFQHAKVRSGRAVIRNATDSFGAGGEIAGQLRAPDLRAVFVLSRGIDINGSELARGLNARLPSDVIVTGGLAGDGARFGHTWVVSKSEIDSNSVVAIGLYGSSIRVSHGSKGGWDTFGPERVVTAAENNVLYRLDDRPALALYKEYLGDRATGLPSSALLFPLALRSGDDRNSVVRTVLGVDEATQSMTFAGDIPVGAYAKLMRANFDRLILGAQAAGTAAFGEHVGQALCIAISCVGRRLVLGERTEEEVEATLDVLPAGTQQVGFYSYGELSPHTTGRCDLHNQTMTLTVFSEAA